MGQSSLGATAAALALIITAGFLFLHTSYIHRFRIAHENAQTKASLYSVFGLAMLVFSSLLIVAVQELFPSFKVFMDGYAQWARLVLFDLPGQFPGALAMAIFLGMVWNVVLLAGKSSQPYLSDSDHPLHSNGLLQRIRLAALAYVAERSNDTFLATLWRASSLGELVQVTLKSRKVYIGSVVNFADPSVEMKWLRLVPLASGYRDKDSLGYIEQTSYLPLFEAMSPGRPNGKASITLDGKFEEIQFDDADLGILVSLAEVSSLTLYEPGLEAYFRAATDQSVHKGSNPERSETKGGDEA